MFSKLVFNINGEEIELHSHEVVKMAFDLMNNENGTPLNIYPHEFFDFIFDDMKKLGAFAHAAEEDTLDPLLFVPAHIGGMKTL